MKEEILEIIKSVGPVVPNELTSKIGKDSFIISALLSELFKEGLINISVKKVGTSPLYYIKGQEELARKRLLPELKIPERKTVEFFEQNKLMLKENLSPQQRFIVDSLSDFITKINLNINGEEKTFYKHYSIPSEVIYEELKRMNDKTRVKPKKAEAVQESLFLTKVEKVKKEKTVNPKKEAPIAAPEVYVKVDETSDEFFKKNNISIIKSLSNKGSEASFIGRANYSIPQNYYIKYLIKKSVSENDVSKAYTESNTHKMPCLIITTGKIAKKAELLISSVGSLVNVARI